MTGKMRVLARIFLLAAISFATVVQSQGQGMSSVAVVLYTVLHYS